MQCAVLNDALQKNKLSSFVQKLLNRETKLLSFNGKANTKTSFISFISALKVCPKDGIMENLN